MRLGAMRCGRVGQVRERDRGLEAAHRSALPPCFPAGQAGPPPSPPIVQPGGGRRVGNRKEGGLN